MNSSSSRTLVAALAGTLLVACVPDEITVNVHTEEEQEPTSSAPGAPAPIIATNRVAPRDVSCQKWLIIEEADAEGHLQVGQSVRIRKKENGPDYAIRAIPVSGKPDHVWKLDEFDAFAVNASGVNFQAAVIVKGGPHNVEEPHLYDVTIASFDENGCPHEVWFDIDFDTDDEGDDHGGHAVGRGG